MTHTYNITGMTCNGCVSKAKSELLKLGDITEAHVQLTAPQATITMQKHIPLLQLQNALHKAGNYTISQEGGGSMKPVAGEIPASWFSTYKPILIIGAYITGVSLLAEMISGGFAIERWMSNFMAGFFLVFSFFKLLNVQGFADSYAMYDIIAKKWKAWGYIYAFIELALGIAYLVKFDPLITNAVTFIVMSISIIGVLQSVLNKQKIKCACLGSVFNLPMSTVTILEDGLMIAMSIIAFLTLLQG